MSQKAEKPTLSGQRLKTRKRDEKEKYDATAFRDSVLQGLNEAGNDLEAISKFLDSSRLDYRRYAEPLFDVLFAGGLLAPGGSIVDEETGLTARAETCVFTTQEDHDALKSQYEIFYKLIRRYKYLERSFEDELKKLIMFLKGFKPEERRRLARITGICLANGLGNPSALLALLEDHLVKEGLALEFATLMFEDWLAEKDIGSVHSTLKKCGLDSRLMEIFPFNKRTLENFENHFKAAGLNQIVEFQRARAIADIKRDTQRKVETMIRDEEPAKEIITFVKEQMKKNGQQEHDACVMMWNAIIGAVEWNKKEELVADQALKHLKLYTSVLASLATTGRTELALLQKVQVYCYDNMNFMKVFQKIVILFYKTDVVSEDIILKWYRDGHLDKGKSVFLDQMKKFVEWLQNAEEESEEED